MRNLYWPALLALLSSPAMAEDYQATTNANVVSRSGPGTQYEQIGTIPARTPVAVDVCFDRGAFCLVQWEGQEGFVSGDLITVANSTQKVHDAEAAKWANWDKPKAPITAGLIEARNIVVWGDNLSAETFGRELGNLLGRDVEMQGVGGDTGAMIAARRLATSQYDERITIVWDRHGRGSTPSAYLTDLEPFFSALKHDRFIVMSDIRSMEAGIDIEVDRRETEAINRALKAVFPSNFLDVTGLVDAREKRSDGLHLTPASYDEIAAAIADFITAKGW